MSATVWLIAIVMVWMAAPFWAIARHLGRLAGRYDRPIRVEWKNPVNLVHRTQEWADEREARKDP